MAKPKHGRRYNYNSDARPFPSQATLAALALVAAAPSVVAGSPLPLPTQPPEFLCPFIQRDLSYPSSSTSSPTPTPSRYSAKNQVADRYVEGSDRSWRKTSSWILYGSTCCPSSVTMTPTQSHPSQTPTPTSTSSTPSTAFDTSSLPAGWNNTNTSSPTESTTILALAIVLAVSICVFILGCLVWRRRKKRARDIERKLARKHPMHDDSSGDAQERDARGKMRTWARASARWKSNIRQSARRRRKRPLASSAVNQLPSPPVNDTQLSVDTPSPSHRSSLSAEEPVPPSPATALLPDDSSTSQSQHDPPRPSSPPVYGASAVPRFANSPSPSAMCNLSSVPPPDRPQSAQSSYFVDDEPPYIPCSDGHVALDEKSHLARIRELASSPPAIQASESTTQAVSAPEWREVEDDLEGLGIDLSEVSMSVRDFGFPPPFPSPPKAGVSFGYLDDHPFPHGNADDILVPSIPGPSESPSAPFIDYSSLEPSAPSLEDADDLFQDWDAASSCVPEFPASVDPGSTPARTTDSFTPPAVPFTSLSPVRRTATRNSILPQYHP